MRGLIRTNDAILLSFLSVLLKDAGIAVVELDAGMSSLEGSIGALPRRLAVADCDYDAARSVLRQAGLAEWICDDERG